MKLSPARYISILGTEVHAAVSTAAEGKTALKEIRQKKNEYGLERRALIYQQKKARAAVERAQGGRAGRKKTGVVATLRRMLGKAQARTPKRSVAELESQIHDIDEILFNLESCKVQIEGKLLSLS
ncbi:MAG TPA: hypothetical protein PKD49_00945 [Hyphomicrobium sp.]|nr:hypothetical protein [Hyphomicrobium sp.]